MSSNKFFGWPADGLVGFEMSLKREGTGTVSAGFSNEPKLPKLVPGKLEVFVLLAFIVVNMFLTGFEPITELNGFESGFELITELNGFESGFELIIELNGFESGLEKRLV